MSKDTRRPLEPGGKDDSAQSASGVTDRQRVPVSGGVLVYEAHDIGRELIGFENVTDTGDLADALAARSHARESVYHLPVLDMSDDKKGPGDVGNLTVETDA